MTLWPLIVLLYLQKKTNPVFEMLLHIKPKKMDSVHNISTAYRYV